MRKLIHAKLPLRNGWWLGAASLVFLLLSAPVQVQAVTYANASVPFNWIDASGHSKVGYNTVPYKFNNTGGCGTTPPILDDTLSDSIPIGFTFMYGGVNFSQVRIMSNGRLQFNDNTTCGFGSPVTQLPYPDAGLNYTMRIYGNDLDPTLSSEAPGYNTVCTSRTTCYVSYATLGTAPYRSFVVTWSNVPEWTGASTASGGYNLQIILQENGEFIYQYGADTPGPGNTNAQIGWQVDANDYDVPSVGFPANNSAIKFFIPRPVAEYRMEQPSWNGTAGEVRDTSGNGRNGVRVGSAQTTAAGFACRGAAIPSNNNAGTIDAINTGIVVPTTVGGAGTITFWYDPAAWASNISQDAQLFDATVANNQWFFLVKRRISNTNSVLRFVIRDSTGTDRVVETPNLGNSVLSATGWVHIAVSWNFNALGGSNNDHMRIYVNGVQQVQGSFTSAGTVSGSIGTLYVGDNRSGFIGHGGSGRSASGTLDEFRIYNYEGGLALVQRDMSQASGACLAHYAISHAGSGKACQANNVTIAAHDVNHNLIPMPNNTTAITLSTSTGLGDWSLVNGYGVLNNGTANDGMATYLFNGEYQAVFALNHSTAGAVNINVTDGQLVENAAEDPTLTLTACVSKFNACHNYTSSNCSAASGRLYTRLAGTAFSGDVVALNSSDAVETAFAGKVNVSLIARSATGSVDGFNCFVPGYSQTVDAAVTGFSAGRLTLGSITVPNAYRDARFKFVCDATNCPPSGMTWCSADNFAVRPQALTVVSTANADSTGTSASAAPTIKAGAGFGLTATAVAGYDGTPKLDSAQVAAHAGATRTGTLLGTFGAADGATGAATGAAFSYDDVGYFRLNADGVYDDAYTVVDQPSDCTNDFSNTAVGGKYGCKFGNVAATGYFGRFVPDHFTTTVTQGCSSGNFTYSAQPFTVNVAAWNGAVVAAVTQNYAGSFAKPVTLTDGNALAVGSFGTTGSIAAPSFFAGIATVNTPAYTFGSRTTAPAAIKLRATDAPDGVTSSGAAEGTATIDSGRLRIMNAYGSEFLALPVTLVAQYWSGAAWVTNTPDNCTALTPPASGSGLALHLANGGTTVATLNNPLAAGNASLKLTAPGAGHAGYVDITVNSPAWLDFNWKGAGDTDPAARATFGIYKNANEFVYIRENY